MNDNLTVKIKIDTSGATSQLKNTSQQIKNLSTNSTDTSASLKEVQASLNSIQHLSLNNLTTSILAISSKLKHINNDINKMTGGFKGLFNIANDNDYVNEVGKFKAIIGSIEFGVDGIKTGFKNVAEIINNSCIPALLKFASVLAPIAAVIASIKNAISVAASGDEIKDESQKLHLNATAYQEWGYVMEQNGVQISALKMGMRQFSKEISSGGDKLKQYGIYTNDVSEAFEQSIYYIQNLTSETQKIAVMTDLFGTRASELYPVLNMTNEETKNLMDTYRAIGGTMSNELVAASDKLTDSITAMKAAWQGLKNTLATSIIPIITQIVQWLTVAISYVSIFLKTLLGISETFGGNGAVSEGSNNLKSNMASTEKSAAKISKYLASFDELNVMTSNDTAATGTSTDIDTTDLEGVANALTLPDKMLEKIADFKSFMADIETEVQRITPILMMTAGWLLICSGHIVLGASLVGLGLATGVANGMFDSVGDAAAALAGTLGLAAGLTLICGGHLAAGAALAGIAIGAVVGSTIFKDMNDSWKAYESVLMTAVGVALILMGHPVIGASLAGIGIGQAITVDWATVFNVEEIKTAWQEVKVAWKQYWTDWAAEVSSNWKELKTNWNQYWTEMGTNLSNTWSNFKEVVKLGMSNVKETISTKWTSIKSLFKDVFTVKYWTTKFNTIKNGVADGMKNVMNAIISKVELTVNRIVNKFNNTGLLKGINKILGTSISLPTIKITRFAKGGVINQPTVAMMGEYTGAGSNPELVGPQSVFRDMINESNEDLAETFISIGRQIISAINDNQLEVKIGDDVIARSAQRGNQSYKNRTGSPLWAY